MNSTCLYPHSKAPVKHQHGSIHPLTNSPFLFRSCGRSEATFLSELDLVRSDFLDDLKRATEPGQGWGNGLSSAISPRDVASICGGIYLIRFSSSFSSFYFSSSSLTSFFLDDSCNLSLMFVFLPMQGEVSAAALRSEGDVRASA
jgi:hypothetical protein